MANKLHVAMLLCGGVHTWNSWRKGQQWIPRPDLIMADLSGANLSGMNLKGADLSRVDLSRANLSGADLSGASLFDALLKDANLRGAKLIGTNLYEAVLNGVDLTKANLSGANLNNAVLNDADLFNAVLNDANLSGAGFGGANLCFADLSGADLRNADLNEARLSGANLSGANLSGAILSEAMCVGVNFSHANLSDCQVYGIAAWDVNLDGATQTNLRVAAYSKPGFMVDNLEVAQLLHLLIRSQNTRDVLDTVTSRVVLILGRFGEQNANLDTLREALRHHPNGYIPVLYESNPQADMAMLETVNILAKLARFIVANLTDANRIRSELTYIMANVPTVPVQLLIEEDASLPPEYSTWQSYRSFLPVYRYADFDQVIANLATHLIEPVERHVQARRISYNQSS